MQLATLECTCFDAVGRNVVSYARTRQNAVAALAISYKAQARRRGALYSENCKTKNGRLSSKSIHGNGLFNYFPNIVITNFMSSHGGFEFDTLSVLIDL